MIHLPCKDMNLNQSGKGISHDKEQVDLSRDITPLIQHN